MNTSEMIIPRSVLVGSKITLKAILSSTLLSVLTCQVFGNLCSSKKATQCHDLPGLTCWPGTWCWHMRPPHLTSISCSFQNQLPGGTHTLWILITCGRVTFFLIRLVCPGTSAESFTQEERSEMTVSKVIEAFTWQVKSCLMISNNNKKKKEGKEEGGNICLRPPSCSTPFV